ncbi:MAG: hypothetical protein OQL19_01755 [Gammaproteobacteria bacterium]|nr:hypothetical protein [Gammaproteobacteria bacterium]
MGSILSASLRPLVTVLAVCIFFISTIANVSADASKKQAAGAHQNADGGWSYVYTLPSNSQWLYPDKSWLPQYYVKSYPDLATTIKTFTNQSLSRDGIAGGRVSSVTPQADGTILMVISGSDSKQLANFATMHQGFMSSTHAVQGLNGTQLCQSTQGCWDPHPGKEPWSFFLPFGLPLSQQKAVSFLNYPPDDSLTDVDYLKNFTMYRWSAVLESVGISDPYLYETIVDARPIAAPGSGQSNYMPDINTYFNKPNSQYYYVTPMIELLTNTPANVSSNSLPVIVLGTPSRDAWAEVIGQSQVNVLDVGTTTLPGASKPTAWVAGNHPDVTTYQCCPGDPNSNCGGSYDLVQDETIDLQVACIIQALGADPAADPTTVKAACAQAWAVNPSPANKATICVRAKQDYDFTTDGQCKTQAEAEAFCNYYNNNACPTGVYSCNVPKSKK